MKRLRAIGRWFYALGVCLALPLLFVLELRAVRKEMRE